MHTFENVMCVPFRRFPLHSSYGLMPYDCEVKPLYSVPVDRKSDMY